MGNRKWKSPTTDGKGKNIKIYLVWKGIKNRCTNQNNKDYKHYGLRGITITEQWLSYDVFYNWAIDNGYKEGLQIDRFNNDGNYEPDNCRFVEPLINRLNKRVTGKSKYKGVCFHKGNKKFVAVYNYNKTSICLGYYDKEEDAAKAWNIEAMKHDREIHTINKV
jgi:hypothetical protein